MKTPFCRGEHVYLPVTFNRTHIEDDIDIEDGFCVVDLPEGFEYRFAEGSIPQLIIKKKMLKRGKAA